MQLRDRRVTFSHECGNQIIKAPALDEVTKFRTCKATIRPHLQSQAKGILRVLPQRFFAPLEQSLLSCAGVKYSFGLTGSIECKSLCFHHRKSIFTKPNGELVIVRLRRASTGLKKVGRYAPRDWFFRFGPSPHFFLT